MTIVQFILKMGIKNNKIRKDQIFSEMKKLRGGEFEEWYRKLSENDKNIYSECLEELKQNFEKKINGDS